MREFPGAGMCAGLAELGRGDSGGRSGGRGGDLSRHDLSDAQSIGGADSAEACRDERPNRELQQSRMVVDAYQGHQRRSSPGNCDEVRGSASHEDGGIGGHLDLPTSDLCDESRSDIVKEGDDHGPKAASDAACGESQGGPPAPPAHHGGAQRSPDFCDAEKLDPLNGRGGRRTESSNSPSCGDRPARPESGSTPSSSSKGARTSQ
jgi:hypothetical protein